MIDYKTNINTGLKQIDSYFKSAFSVDCVIFGFDGKDLKVLLVKCLDENYLGQTALIGDLVDPKEDLDEAAYRILKNRTGLSDVYLEQVKAFGRVSRHPTGRVITVAYYSLINIEQYQENSASYHNQASWMNVQEVGELAFDHNEIVEASRDSLKNKVLTHPVGFNLLSEKFTLTELQNLYEAILDKPLDKRNFRKKIISMNVLVDLEEMQKDVPHRPARLYSFDEKRYEQLLQSRNFNFDS